MNIANFENYSMSEIGIRPKKALLNADLQFGQILYSRIRKSNQKKSEINTDFQTLRNTMRLKQEIQQQNMHLIVQKLSSERVSSEYSPRYIGNIYLKTPKNSRSQENIDFLQL